MSFLLQGCNKDTVSEVDIRIASLQEIEVQGERDLGKHRVVRSGEHDYVPEAIAQSVVRQLAAWGPNGSELIKNLYACSAEHAYALSKTRPCDNKYNGETDPACLLQRGFGKNSLGQALAAARIDLNGDGVKDYLISDRYYCMDMSANQAKVFFVMLSQPSGNFQLSFADWASYGLGVVDDTATKEKVLIERAGKSFGTYTNIMQLVKGRYTPRTCVFQDEHGFRKCETRADK